MKFIDFVIIFSIFFTCILTKNNINNQLIFSNQMFNGMYNDCIDNIVVDSLEAGFFMLDEDNNPIVDKDIMAKCFESELSILLSDTSYLKDIGSNYCLLIYVCEDGYFLYDNMSWSLKYLFLSDSHSERVLEMEEQIKKAYVTDLLFSSNDGEKFKNSVKRDSLIAIYQGKSINFGDNKYQVYSVSGAAIVEDKVSESKDREESDR